MTEREMLELAARAAGYEFRWAAIGNMGCARAREPGSGDAFPLWNPLTDDGDALRLAVKLNLLIMPYPEENTTRVVRRRIGADPDSTLVWWGTSPDALAAARLAITLAAAEIGRAMASPHS